MRSTALKKNKKSGLDSIYKAHLVIAEVGQDGGRAIQAQSAQSTAARMVANLEESGQQDHQVD